MGLYTIKDRSRIHTFGFIPSEKKIEYFEKMQEMRLREKQQEEAGIEWPIGRFMIIREKRQEEAGIERPIGRFMRLREIPQEMMLREQQQKMRLREILQEMIHCEILQEIRHREELQKEAEIERTMGHFMILREQLQEAIPNADTSEMKLIFGKQKVHISNRRSCHGTKLLKSSLSLAPFFVPCAGGTGHGSSQPEHQGHSEIYPFTLKVVSNCPSLGEYMQRSFTKCADVCGSYMQDGNCAYHCMRDSSKTKLVEFCAKPKPLFDFCPEYDPVDQTIQKDLATLCNSTSSRNYYISSDIYFCDPNNCLQLRESSGATTLTTLINETTEMNGGDNQEWFLPLTVFLAALILAITIGCILLFVTRGIFSVFSTYHKMTTKRNQNDRQHL